MTLVPREGVDPNVGGNAYGDRRLRDVKRVDYSDPGFAVVFAEGAPRPTGVQRSRTVAVEILETRVGAGLAPREIAMAAGDALRLTNTTDRTQVVSLPRAAFLAQLAPAEMVEIPVAAVGESSLFLLGASAAESKIFAAPGSFSRVSRSGRYVLSGLAPGVHRVQLWHARFPPAQQAVEISAGESFRLDLEIGVGQGNSSGLVSDHHGEGHAH